jgi:hypothetical protein
MKGWGRTERSERVGAETWPGWIAVMRRGAHANTVSVRPRFEALRASATCSTTKACPDPHFGVRSTPAPGILSAALASLSR